MDDKRVILYLYHGDEKRPVVQVDKWPIGYVSRLLGGSVSGHRLGPMWRPTFNSAANAAMSVPWWKSRRRKRR